MPTSHIPTQDIMKDEFDWEIPVEAVPIPSAGQVYPAGSSLHGRDRLEIKAMTAREEDILASRALIQQGKVVSRLIESCLIDKSVNVNDMLLGDKNALMISIRITGYGSLYKSESTCPSCKKQSKQEFNLSELEIKRLTITPVKPGENIFEFKLPVTGKDVLFKFLTGIDDEERSIIAERKKKLMPGIEIDESVTSRLTQQVLSVAGITDKNKLGYFVKNMPARDSRALRTYIEKHSPGIDMSTWMKCPHCTEASKVNLPIGSNFFWPEE